MNKLVNTLTNDLLSNKIENEEDNLKKERKGILLAVLSNLFWALNATHIKVLSVNFPQFTPNNFTFWRTFGVYLVVSFIKKQNNIQLKPLSEIENKQWFAMRTFGNYFTFVFFIWTSVYFRAATATCFTAASPIIVVFLSYFFLREKFYYRYIIGLCLCLLGTFLIISNERKGVSFADDIIDMNNSTVDADATLSDASSSSNMMAGTMFGLCHLLFMAFLFISTKKLANEKIDINTQMYYVSISNIILAALYMMYERSIGLNFLYMILSTSNGIIYYTACYLQNASLGLIDLSKYTPTTYFATLFTFLIGAIILGEGVFFTDLIGSFLIVSFNTYNTWYPVRD